MRGRDGLANGSIVYNTVGYHVHEQRKLRPVTGLGATWWATWWGFPATRRHLLAALDGLFSLCRFSLFDFSSLRALLLAGFLAEDSDSLAGTVVRQAGFDVFTK